MYRNNEDRKSELGFIHRFVSGNKDTKLDTHKRSRDKEMSPPTFLLLHGTGGNEDDLIPLGQMLSSRASILSPRGKILENGMPRFFKRLSEGVFDLEDLKHRTQELANFVKEASIVYSFDLNKTIAIGFSNGANIAASLLLSNPETIKGAILFRGMIPFIPNRLPDLTGKQVLLLAGEMDPIIPKDQVEGLLELFRKSNASVSLKWQQAGHNLTNEDILDAKEWFLKTFY